VKVTCTFCGKEADKEDVQEFKEIVLAVQVVQVLSARVSTEFRRHGIPSVFFLLPSIPYSVRNWLQFRRNSAEFRVG
jgi:hypothetical protein